MESTVALSPPIAARPKTIGTFRFGARAERSIVLALLMIQVVALAWQARQDSPTWDEVGHFAAGLDIWENGRFDLYKVNPPLVRAVALAPVAFCLGLSSGVQFRGVWAYRQTGPRPELFVGPMLAQRLRSQYFGWLTIARYACIPFSVLCAWICYKWTSEIWGAVPGCCALALVVFSPTVLAYGHLITPDMGAASMAVAAAYVFRRWLKAGGWARAAQAGGVLGLAELAKSSLIILMALWVIIWGISRAIEYRKRLPQVRKEAIQVSLLLIVAVVVLNLGYSFEDSFRPLGEFNFASSALTGPAPRNPRDETRSNRFRGTALGMLPVPLPANYVEGIDIQRSDFEHRMWSYLNGEWRFGGWWYYYLYAMLVKEPLGVWALGGIAIVCLLRFRGYSASIGDELLLLVPSVCLIALVSSQTGFNHHVRYVLPAFPFLFISVSRAAKSFTAGHGWASISTAGAILWSISSSVCAFPHSLSYFNEVAGGPLGGHFHLGNSNADWGQDLLNLRRWLDKHPEAAPLHFACDMPLIDPKMAGIESLPVPIGPHSNHAADVSVSKLGPLPGWYAISVNKLHDLDRNFDYFLDLKPVGRAGYSIYIYDVTTAQVNALRKKLGLPALENPTTQSSGRNGNGAKS